MEEIIEPSGGDNSTTKKQDHLGEAPDPEDDLDELDDLLDEFSTANLHAKHDTLTASGPGRPTLSEAAIDEVHDPEAARDFSTQLQEQMEALMGEIDQSPEMKQQIETMMKELGAEADATPRPAAERIQVKDGKEDAPGPSKLSTNVEESFQETIRKTMERIQTSGDQATAAATSDDPDNMLAQMLKDMQNNAIDGADEDQGLSKMLMGMMEQLTNKDILYEPMKELHDKFPGWMSNNKSSAKADDLKRYIEQQKLVGEIVKKFEEKGYSDDKVADREFIVERMQRMQAAGSPPADLVGDMNAAQEALGDLDSGCAQQ